MSSELSALVLQGGGALGAYQAGAAEALDAADHPIDWVAGISIGAINAALVAGNDKAGRGAALQAFWKPQHRNRSGQACLKACSRAPG